MPTHQLLKIKNAISDASDGVASASDRLNDLMRRDIHTQFRVSSVADVDPDLDTPEALESRALQDRPDLKKATLQVQQADYDARAKLAEYIPDVSLAFDYNTTANFENILPSNIGTVGLSLRWEPWDWGRKRQEYAAKRVKEEQAKVAVDATQRGILLEVRNACRQLENTRRKLALSDATERAARQKLQEVQEQVRRQAALTRDLFQAQSDLASADSQQQQALAAFWKARADLKKASENSNASFSWNCEFSCCLCFHWLRGKEAENRSGAGSGSGGDRGRTASAAKLDLLRRNPSGYRSSAGFQRTRLHRLSLSGEKGRWTNSQCAGR